MTRGYSAATWATVSVLLLLLAMPRPAASQDSWGDMLRPILSLVTSLWKNEELEFMGNSCFYYQRPQLRAWQLYYEGSLSCPTWNSISGEAYTRSQSGVMTNTVKDYLNKATAAGLVTEEEARVWLTSHAGEEEGEEESQILDVQDAIVEKRERA